VVLDAMAAHLAEYGTGEHELVFHADGRPIRRATATGAITRAAATVGLAGRSWHDLRHYHASVLLSKGVSPALVAERLGHDVKDVAHHLRARHPR
jgi:integrase